jgi:gamma-glutamyl hydrolase
MAKIIGIITVPLSPDKKFYKVCGDSYISNAHIDMLKRVGLDILAIPYTTDEYDYYMDRINGLYFPSGGVFASNSPAYYNCCKEFFYKAIERNDSGEHFPIWGSCMGMQQMMIIGDEQDNLDNFLEEFDSFENLLLSIKTTGYPSRLMEKAPRKVLNMLSQETTLNNHRMGLCPKTFLKNKKLKNRFRIVGTSRDRQDKEFIAIIEAINYPFYGFQWHPERNTDYDYFSKFFAKEVQKNPVKKRVPNSKKLQYRKVHCMNYSGQIYKYCRFYWHTRSSFHNKALCSVLNLGDPVGTGV